MLIGRLNWKERPVFGVVEREMIDLLSGPPWEEDIVRGSSVPLAGAEFLAPVSPSKVVCVGKNYITHIEEMGFEQPKRPSLFLKPPTTIVGPGKDIVLPPEEVSNHVEHEAELALVIGKRARNVAESKAMDYVFGFTCANDVSARDIQSDEADIVRAKGFDTFCPLGPWISTDLDLTRGVEIRCRVNGGIRQDGNTSDMLFTPAFLVSYISAFMTLLPGDVVLTGSPGGSSRLTSSDVVAVEIGGIGTLENPVRHADTSKE